MNEPLRPQGEFTDNVMNSITDGIDSMEDTFVIFATIGLVVATTATLIIALVRY